MKAPGRTLLLGSLLSMATAVCAQPAASPGPVVVTFEDGGQVEVSDWIFRYNWNEFGSGAFYTPANKKSGDLIIEVNRTRERGVTVTEDRTVPGTALAAIKYDIERLGPGSWRIRSVTITLTTGEIIRAASLTPSPKLLTEGRESARNHAVSLVGRATLRGQPGAFDMQLNSIIMNEPRDTIIELRFAQK